MSHTTRYQAFPETMQMLYRSEAFAEDLEPEAPAAPRRSRVSGRQVWLLLSLLPLGVALLGSVTALVAA